jgi:tRNA-specific 2-thiouridylase
VRFGALLERVEALGCDVLVTGHHARIDHVDGRFRLLAGRDSAKDQSYVLHMLGQAELARIVLPIGEMTKEEVRAEAERLGLRTATKPDSQDLCFVHGDYRDFLREHFPETARSGSIVDSDGTVVGSHDGVSGFTVGQRRGLGVSLGEPRFVLGVDAGTATVTVGTRAALAVGACALDEVSFVSGADVADELEIVVKVRYRSRPVPAVLRRSEAGWRIRFDQPVEGVAPGQAAVFYLDDEVLGGGTIVATA